MEKNTSQLLAKSGSMARQPLAAGSKRKRLQRLPRSENLVEMLENLENVDPEIHLEGASWEIHTVRHPFWAIHTARSREMFWPFVACFFRWEDVQLPSLIPGG